MKYIDRENETKRIESIYKQLTGSALLFLYSKTGVGKSTLLNRFIENHSNNDDVSIIRVFTNRINKNKATVNGAYLIEIFKSFSSFFEHNNELSFENYIMSEKNKTHRKYVLEKILEDVRSQSTFKAILIKVLGTFFINRIFKLGYYNCDVLINDFSAQSLQLINGYIEYILKNKRIILAMDNLQNADDIAIEYIRDWIVHTKSQKHFFICEYTITNDVDRIAVLTLRDSLCQLHISVNVMELSKMDCEHAIQAAALKNEDQDNISIPNNTQEIYKNSEGNIRYLEDFLRHYNTDHKYEISYTPTIDSILSLNKDALLVFCTICINNACINRFELQAVLNDYHINWSAILKVLRKNYDLVEEHNNIISIKHASIVDSWKSIKENKIKTVNINAYNALATHYNKLLNNSESSSTRKAFIYLLKLYSDYDKEKIYNLLNQFDELAVEFVNINQLQDYIKQVDSEIENNRHKFVDFYYKLIDICLDLKLYVEANDLLDKIQDYSPSYKYIFYKCNVYIQSEKYNENINFINSIISSIENDYFILYLKLFLMISYRSINDYDAVKKIDDDIQLAISKYDTTIFYAFYLRLAEIREPRNLAINDVLKSIELFKKKHLDTQAAKSRVTLSFLYAITNKIEQAQEQSNRAEKIIMKKMVNRHVFFNNKAAIYMLTGNVSPEIWDMLAMADITAMNIFDKLVVCNNKLAFALGNNDFDNARIEMTKIKNLLDSETDKHLKAILYYNMYLYYYNIQDYANADKYYNNCFSIKEHCKSLYARLTKTKTDDNTDILFSQDWHVAFMDFWFIDYVEDF